MSLTPRRWYNFHERVLDLWRVFQTQYGGDTGSAVVGNNIWISADSGFLAQEATEAERLRVISAAHQPANMAGNSLALDSNNLLKKMGRGTSLNTDTGREGNA
jgi:hypothetical protein